MHRLTRFLSIRPVFGLLAASACLLLTTHTGHAENLVVFKASGLFLTPGQTVAGDQPLRLTQGQSVELIGANGRVIRLKGPHDKPPAPNATDKGEKGEKLAEALQSMVTASAADPNHMGVTRSTEAVLKDGGRNWLPDPWLINVTRSGRHCQREGEPVIFWRPDKNKESEIRLATLGNTWKASTRWPAGADKLAPPLNLPLKEETVYQITLDKTKSDLTLVLIPEPVTSAPIQAAWMKESGCEVQSMALVRDLTKKTDPSLPATTAP
ncbi:MAG: hypothetical protein HQL99_10490 [Magnetococcales bacterium]|nr:hypothetical protein [Magnetococcales bacterium]